MTRREEAVERLLPWRGPFLMIDRLLDWTPERSITTLKRVTANDPLMSGRPAAPRFPTILLLEGLSQSAALLYRLTYESQRGALPLLGLLDATFEPHALDPGTDLRFEVRAVKMTRTGGLFEGRAWRGETTVASAELGFAAARNETGENG